MPRIAGVNVVGPLRAESGVGEAARAVVAALDAAGIPVIPIEPSGFAVSQNAAPLRVLGVDQAAFGVTILCLTAAETLAFGAAVGPEFFRGRHTIGLWWWEVTSFPEALHPAFAYVDEVWAGSAHVAEALRTPAEVAGVPLTQIRVPVRRAPVTRMSRAQLDLPGGFLFLTVFGYFSSVARKNPLGVVEAFRRAFLPGEGPVLAVKCLDEAAHPAEHAVLLHAAAQHPDIHVLSGCRSRQSMDALVQSSDAIVSLHRAEGFGFTPAEAMAQGKPVIATAYSGTLDYMGASNAMLIPAAIVRIGEHGGPYPPYGVWAEPDLDAAAAAMRRLVAEPELGRDLGVEAARTIQAEYSESAAGAIMRSALDGQRDQHRWARARLRAAKVRWARAPRRRVARREKRRCSQ